MHDARGCVISLDDDLFVHPDENVTHSSKYTVLHSQAMPITNSPILPVRT
jgi:hypothetical protein